MRHLLGYWYRKFRLFIWIGFDVDVIEICHAYLQVVLIIEAPIHAGLPPNNHLSLLCANSCNGKAQL